MGDTLRGSAMHKEDGEWVFTDTGDSVKETYRDRPCGRCNGPNTPEGHDACLGQLPGVLNACCGHGDRKNAYIHFANGVIIRGFDIVDRRHEQTTPDLNMSELVTFNPDWVSPPGDTIRDILAEEQMTVDDLAEELAISVAQAHRLCEGNEPLTVEIARALVLTFGGSVGFWLEREIQYQDGLKQGKKIAGRDE